MKTFRVLVLLLVVAAPLLAQYPSTKPGPVPARKPDAPKKKEEPPAKIEGMEIARGDKGFLGLQVVGSVFKLSFYDANKKPVAPGVARAALRWEPRNSRGRETAMLVPGGGPNVMTSEKTVPPPYNFRLVITLLKAEGTDAAASPPESYTVDFRQ